MDLGGCLRNRVGRPGDGRGTRAFIHLDRAAVLILQPRDRLAPPTDEQRLPEHVSIVWEGHDGDARARRG